jgi:predicted porin
MNKTLIAMAVAGVMAAPMAAQADATIYGKIHVSIDSGDDGQDSALYWQSNSSRIGFKGSEDLGGGLSAIWQFESNIDVGSGSTAWGGRNSYLGLKGGWGTFLGGRHDTPFKSAGRVTDLFGDQVGDTRNLNNGRDALGQGSSVGFDLRLPNVVVYKTPTFGGGFDIVAAYALEDGVDTEEDAMSIAGNWKSGDWKATLAYETHGAGWSTGTEEESGLRAGVKWTPGAWILALGYSSLADLDGVSGQDSDAINVGVGFKTGKNVLKVQYTMADNEGDDVDATNLAVGWDYNMSKRTTAYIAYSTTDNDDNVGFAADASGHGAEVGVAGAGEDPAVISFGMIHKF